MPTYHLLIRGRVQGVFYRASAKNMAEELGITGWIKNTIPGDVEAVITGSEKQIEAFVNWSQQGPIMSEVLEVIVTKQDEIVFADFCINR